MPQGIADRLPSAATLAKVVLALAASGEATKVSPEVWNFKGNQGYAVTKAGSGNAVIYGPHGDMFDKCTPDACKNAGKVTGNPKLEKFTTSLASNVKNSGFKPNNPVQCDVNMNTGTVTNCQDMDA